MSVPSGSASISRSALAPTASILFGAPFRRRQNTLSSRVINPINKLTDAIHIYGGDFFAAERSEWDSLTLLEHRSDGERVRRVFEEANARYEVSKHIGAG
jgi:hypothetical protein